MSFSELIARKVSCKKSTKKLLTSMTKAFQKDNGTSLLILLQLLLQHYFMTGRSCRKWLVLSPREQSLSSLRGETLADAHLHPDAQEEQLLVQYLANTISFRQFCYCGLHHYSFPLCLIALGPFRWQLPEGAQPEVEECWDCMRHSPSSCQKQSQGLNRYYYYYYHHVYYDCMTVVELHLKDSKNTDNSCSEQPIETYKIRINKSN